VSIGLPIYNGERYVKHSVESLLAQTYRDLEVIISDNASTDGTERICRELASRDSRVRYCRTDKNSGASINFNRVFAMATGEYFKWAAHDDVCATEFLARCVGVLDEHPDVVLCYPRATIIDESGARVEDYAHDGVHLDSERPSQRLRGYLMAKPRMPHHPIFGLIRRSALERTPLIANYVGSDLVLLARLSMAGKFFELPDRLFFRREHTKRSSRMHIEYFVRWWNPNNRNFWFYFIRCRWLVEFLRAVRSADVSMSERYRCYGEVLKWTREELPSLLEDFWDGLYWTRRTLLPRKGEASLDAASPENKS
jgi:glycosyltransferase involved in cell wall biosynthesis